MRQTHPGSPTRPLAPGAPLDKEMRDLPKPRPEDIMDELTRAEVELLYAVSRHRKAWSRMRKRAEEREAIEASGVKGQLADLASDHVWSVRTSDVKWWCAEMTGQAAVVTALRSMLPPEEAHRDRLPSVGY